VKTSWRRLKLDSCQTHQHRTDRLTSDSRQTQTMDSYASLIPESPLSELNLYFSLYTAGIVHSFSQAWRTLAIILGVDCSYAVMSSRSEKKLQCTVRLGLRVLDDHKLNLTDVFSSPKLSQNPYVVILWFVTARGLPTIFWQDYTACFLFLSSLKMAALYSFETLLPT
jgi:hypothetical protein